MVPENREDILKHTDFATSALGNPMGPSGRQVLNKRFSYIRLPGTIKRLWNTGTITKPFFPSNWSVNV